MKITGHTYSVTIRSQLKNVSGSCHRLCGASAASPEFTQEHCVLPRPCASADSSYLNRPIVGPTPPKLPALGSNLRYHRVFSLLSQVLIQHTIFLPRSQVFAQNFYQIFVKIRKIRVMHKNGPGISHPGPILPNVTGLRPPVSTTRRGC